MSYPQSTTPSITSIQFGIYSPTSIKHHSVLQIIHPETLENGIPKDSGLADPRMGVTDPSLLCSTCGLNAMECQGHFGHVELCKPVYHVGYLTKIKKVLECVCFYCSSIKSKKVPVDRSEENSKNDQNVNSKINFEDNSNVSNIPSNQKKETKVSPFIMRHMLNNAWAINKSRYICDSCSNKQPVIRKEGMNLLAFMKGTDNDGKVLLNAEKVHSIFKKISDEDIAQLGFSKTWSRPEWMILTTLIVSPPSCRPAIQMDGLRGEDDLTHKYADIIKANNNLRKYESEGAPAHILRDYEQLLQFHVATLMDNDMAGQPQALQKSGRPLKSLSARLKGKEGRLRYNLMGKRVDFSARTVITSDPNISLDEVGVPINIAMIHTFNEHVNNLNIAEMQECINRGPNVHPGANYIVRPNGQRIDLRFNRSDIILQPDFIVERHLRDGDIVLFNRQPSLHKMSMMAHRVRVMDKKTFRLNLSVTGPYNADFDGDEMNLHAPQSLLTVTELSQLAGVEKQIISPQSNRPVMGIVQDTLIGVRRLTSDGVFITLREAMQLFYAADIGQFLKEKESSNDGSKSQSSYIDNSTFFDNSTSKEYLENNAGNLNGDNFSYIDALGSRTSNLGNKMHKNYANEYLNNNRINGYEFENRLNNNIYESKTINVNDIIEGTEKNNKSSVIFYKSNILPPPTILRPVPLYTGKQIFSWALPAINFSTISTDEKKVLIVDGILHSGIIDKKSVGTCEGGIIHIIFNDYGSRICRRFFDTLQRIINMYITTISCFSVGIGDTIASKVLEKEIKTSIETAKKEVNDIIMDPTRLTRLPGMSLRETFESHINVALNKARNISGACAQKELKDCNNVKQMVMAGSKGSLINISQMTACVGQQNVEGKRIPFGFRNRTLPHFPKDDYGPRSRGFVSNSYLSGLTPEEFYFHAMGGREGLIDTAVKTAETGYIQRRLVKAMEDLKIVFDGSVRSGNGSLTQFCYGDDSLRGESIERCSINEIKENSLHPLYSSSSKTDRNINSSDNNSNKYSRDPDNYNEYENQNTNSFDSIDNMICTLIDNANNQIKKIVSDYKGIMRNEIIEIKKLSKGKTYYMPVNLKRLIWNAKRKYPNSLCDISPKDLYKKRDILEEWIKTKIIHYSSDMRFIEYFRNSLSMVNILYNKINNKQLDYILEIAKDKLGASLAVHDEMVGTLAAQSVGEPATQMTLNTFHLAGVASTVTLGVPRLKEIINIAKTLKTPSMKIEITEPGCLTLSGAKEAQINIEYTQIKDVVDYVQVLYEPKYNETSIEEDNEFVNTHYELAEDYEKDRDQSLGNFVIRMVLDRDRVVGKGIRMENIVQKIREKFDAESIKSVSQSNYKNEFLNEDENNNEFISAIDEQGIDQYNFMNSKLSIITSDDNSETLVIRIRSEYNTEEKNIEFFENIMEVPLLGFKNIKKVFIVEENSKFILHTEGVNFKDLLACPGINTNNLYSNNIIETFEVLGIEAAREVILRELRSVIENEGYVNIRHLSLLADVMTVRGILTGITRHGVNRGEKSSLMRCSFEETVEILMEAAVIGEKSYCKEVTESIILGQNVPVGTGLTEIYLDIGMLKEAINIVGRDQIFDFESKMTEMHGIDMATPDVRSPISDDFESFGGWSPEGDGYSSVGKIYDLSKNTNLREKHSFSPIYTSRLSPGSGGNSFITPQTPIIGGSRNNDYRPTSSGYSPSSPNSFSSLSAFSPISHSYTSTGQYNRSTSPICHSPGYVPTSPMHSPLQRNQTNPIFSPSRTNFFNFSSNKVNITPYSPKSNKLPISPSNKSYSFLQDEEKNKKDEEEEDKDKKKKQ